MRRREPHQRRNFFLVGEVLADPFLQHASEFAPERRVLVRLVRGERRQEVENFLRAARPDRLDVAGLLQDFARYIQRQVAGIDDPPHEAQVRRQQLLGIVHDEHAPHVKPDAVPGVAVPQVERRVRRNVQELRVFLAAFDARVHPGQRVVVVVPDVLVELAVLLVRDFALRPRPERRRLVDCLVVVGLVLSPVLPFLLLHPDRLHDVVRILADDRAKPRAGQQVVLAVAQMQRDFRPALRALRRLDDEFSTAVGLPAHPRGGRLAGAPRQHGDAVGDDERRIEADAELPDEVRVLLLVAGEPRKELARSRLGDRAEVRDHLLAIHADAVVPHDDRPRRLVVVDVDREVAISFEQRGIVDRLEAQLVARVRGVGNQLAQEDFTV